MKRMWLCLACTLLATNEMLWGMTADDVVAKTGIAGGLCSFPRLAAGEENLAIELAKRPAMVVHVLSPNPRLLAQIRDAAQAVGVLGRSLYAEQAGAAGLPFADRLVDLLVVSDLGDADLTPAIRSAWLRALAPRRGTALVGRARAGGGLSPAALRAWTKDLPLARVTADDAGTWALLRTDLPAGSDPWNHRCHGPDNAQVSDDTTLKPPFLAQWWGMPRQEGFWGTTVVAGNGRMFSIRASRNSGGQVFLTARSLTSGVVLWQQCLRPAADAAKVPHGGYVPGRSCAVASDDVLFLVDRDAVLRLDAETGAERGRIVGPKPGGQVKWIACAGRALAVLAGDADVVLPITYQTVAANPTGRHLAVYDRESSRAIWHDTLAGDVDERLIVIRDGRIYCLVQGAGMVCRDLRTGKTLWTNSDAGLQTEFRTPPSKTLGELLFSQPALMALDEVLLLRVKWAKNMVALSRADGSFLWKKPSAGGRALTALAFNGQWIEGGRPTDLKTGKPADGPRHVGSGCGPTTAMPGFLITCFGSVVDMQSGKAIRQDDVKSPCDIGSIVAEGMMVTVPSECGCNYAVKGYRVLTSAADIQPHAAPAWKGRLTALDPAEPAALAVSDADWPTYRRDAQRSAASTAAVGAAPRVLWQWTPAGATPSSAADAGAAGPRLAPDFLATAPVAVAGRVCFASHDGTVHCLQAASGKELWQFATRGMLFAPPTIGQGRVLLGGGDGRVYCLDATTGRCLWQLLAGPADRRLFWFGHLVSTWPVIPGVLLQDGVAYAVAGYQGENGIHAYAVDPKTGNVLWEKDDAGSGGRNGPQAGLGNCGHAAVAGGKLWLSSSPSGGFELKSGDLVTAGGGQFGCEIGVLAGKWVIQGGRRLSETQETLTRPLGESGFVAYCVESPSARIRLSDVGTALPAWDAELTIVPPKGVSGSLTAVPTGKLLDWLGEKAAEAGGPETLAKIPRTKAADWSDLKLWMTEPLTPIAFALARDQLVVASQSGRKHQVSGFRRSDGAKVWTVDLPEQPAMGRLALDREGRVLLALCDGSILCLGRGSPAHLAPTLRAGTH
jgi:outer membrane protein assembly factor BamB